MAKSKKDNENQPDDSADNFGLPDLEYKPLDRDAESQLEAAESAQANESGSSSFERTEETVTETTDYSYEEESPSRAPIFIGLIIGVVILVAGFLIYKYWYVPKAEKERKEQLAREEVERRKAEETRLAAEKADEERRRQEAEAAAKAKPAEGTIETLGERTRRWFVVVTSNVDDDLVMDYAKKLSAKGVSTKIIPPFGNTKFYRLAIADFDTFSAAQSSADTSKPEYGSGLWVIKY